MEDNSIYLKKCYYVIYLQLYDVSFINKHHKNTTVIKLFFFLLLYCGIQPYPTACITFFIELLGNGNYFKRPFNSQNIKCFLLSQVYKYWLRRSHILLFLLISVIQLMKYSINNYVEHLTPLSRSSSQVLPSSDRESCPFGFGNANISFSFL